DLGQLLRPRRGGDGADAPEGERPQGLAAVEGHGVAPLKERGIPSPLPRVKRAGASPAARRSADSRSPAMRAAEYRRAVRRPSIESRSRSARPSSSSCRRSAMPRTSPGSTTSALPRSTAYSGTAPTRVVTGGQPQAIDSRGGSENPS